MDIQYFISRKKLYEYVCLFGGLFIFGGWILGIYLAYKLSAELAIPLFLLLFSAPGIGIIFYFRELYSKLNDKFKEKYLTEIAKDIFPNVKVDVYGGLSEKEIDEANFLRYCIDYKFEDYLEGEISGVRFKTSDVELNNNHDIWGFRGRVFIFEFNKNFRDNLVTMSFGKPHNMNGYSRIKVESKKYNEYFRTYTQNEHEAFYVLTPHFIEKILELEKTYPFGISISFLNNKMYLAIKNDEDTFDLKWYEPLDETVNNYKKELSLIKELILLLKLDVKIFKQ